MMRKSNLLIAIIMIAVLSFGGYLHETNAQGDDEPKKMSDPANCSTREDADNMMFNGQDVLVQNGAESLEIGNNIWGGAYILNTGKREWTWTFVIPDGWFATVHRPDRDKAELFVGNGSLEITAWRATLRDGDCYPADDTINLDPSGCELLKKENTNGYRQEWQFSLLPGNIVCANAPTENVGGNLVTSQSNTPPTNCPTFAGMATTPGSDGGPYCKFEAPSVMSGQVPAGWKMEYWDGKAVQHAAAGATISTNVGTLRPVVQ